MTGKQHTFHSLMSGECSSYLLCFLGLPFHAQPYSFERPSEHPTHVWSNHRSKDGAVSIDFDNEVFCFRQYNSGNQVGVSSNKLGATVQHNVGAVVLNDRLNWDRV
jgi:hypothetical protein